jgi:hypothetical protein
MAWFHPEHAELESSMSKDIEARLKELEDVRAICELKARYCNAADGGWDGPTHDGEAVAALFVEDGAFEGRRHGAAVGRAAIRELFDGLRRSSPLAFHRISNPIVEVDGDTAKGEWHLLCAIHLDGKTLWIGGLYHDEFVRRPEGWRFRRLRFTRAFAAPGPRDWGVPIP